VRITGEQRDGVFRLRFVDDEQLQLVVTAVCPGGRFVGPQPALLMSFGTLEFPDTSEVLVRQELPLPAVGSFAEAGARGVLEVRAAPLAVLTPP
jgi:hypothetical protein